jgi:IMP dehydrogenase
MVSSRYSIDIPIVASPMDTICEYEMAEKMMSLGGIGCVHRFMSIQEQCEIISKLSSKRTLLPTMAAVGVNGDYLERAAELIVAGVNIILIDVAHGHHKNVKDAIRRIKGLDPDVDVIAGNIATAEAAEDLQNWGADGLRVGIGGGSLCSTRIKTGFGVPNVTCLSEIVKVAKVPVMADGGIRYSSDIAKALAIGASTVMLGSLISGTEESPGQIIEKPNGLYKRYRGSASLETKVVHGQEARNVEGESTIIPYKGGVKFIIEGLLDGVRSALSYAGANDINEFAPTIIQITNSGIVEAKPHLL